MSWTTGKHLGRDVRKLPKTQASTVWEIIMSYTYDLSPAACFEDRYSQFIGFGIPKADVDTLQATIKDMWADAPGGWSYEWSAFAGKYLAAGNPLLASFAYGFAKFPCLANEARR